MDRKAAARLRRALSDAGVSDRAADAYVNLTLSQRELAIDELARTSGTSPDEVRADISVLAQHGLCRTDDGVVRPLDPRSFLGSWVREVDADVSDLVARSQRTKEALRTLDEDLLAGGSFRPAGDPDAGITVLPSPAEAERYLEARAGSAEAMDTAFARMPPVEALLASEPLDTRALQRGCRARVIYPTGPHLGRDFEGYVERMAAAGAQLRVHPLPLHRLLILDRSTAILSRGAPGADDQAALAITTPALVSMLLDLFEFWWGGAQDLVATPDQAPNTVEREILSLLREGLSDQAIARRLSISDRTVRRVLSDLSRRAGTQSRFQLGVRATQLGWVS